MTHSALFHGRVYHRRLKPVGHEFAYRVFSFLIDVDDIASAASRLKWFSLNRPNLFSLHAKDHGARRGETIGDHARAILKDAGVSADGRIELLCYPRILGFVFNPLSIYWCRNAAGSLAAVIYEVRNTFGGRHCYVIPAAGEVGSVRQSADKVFHVSPFMDMDMRYHFELSEPRDEVRVLIREDDREGPILVASFEGVREDLSDRALLRAFFNYPLMTLKVVAAIHFEAIRLFAKGLRLKRGAPDPANEATYVAR
jgi:hypothetical protein